MGWILATGCCSTYKLRTWFCMQWDHSWCRQANRNLISFLVVLYLTKCVTSFLMAVTPIQTMSALTSRLAGWTQTKFASSISNANLIPLAVETNPTNFPIKFSNPGEVNMDSHHIWKFKDFRKFQIFKSRVTGTSSNNLSNFQSFFYCILTAGLLCL